MDLKDWGLDPFFEGAFHAYDSEGVSPGRVTLEHKHLYRVQTEDGERLAAVSGKLRHRAAGREDFPAVGDWVVLREGEGEDRAVIDAVLPRRSTFSRKEAGFNMEQQIVAANVDTVLLVTALDRDFNLRRLERYLTVAWESGAMPAVVLTKADLCPDVEEKRADMERTAVGVSVHVVSSETAEGLEELRPYLARGRTVALIGSSGVGKSTLINRLAGDELQETGGVREKDGRGRHTTTHRELVSLPGGGLIIDTPGMRELQLWEDEGGVDHTFADILSLAERCRFADCTHGSEPGCAVQEALEIGALDPARLQNYRKLQRELAYLERKKDAGAMREQKDKWKKKTVQYHKNGWHRR